MKAEIEGIFIEKIVDLVPAFCRWYGDWKYVERYGESFSYCWDKDIIRIILEEDLFEL